MPKIKTHRSAPSLDMTPMVDLAFLLVTFFMLISQFKPEEVVIVDTPSSTSDIKLPESDIITITVDKEGKVFYGVDAKGTKLELINKMSAKYGVGFTDAEKDRFANLSSFGVPVAQLRQYLNTPKEQQKTIKPGIPSDTIHNELGDWVHQTRLSNPKVRIAIKGDHQADVPTIKRVIKILQDVNVNKFNLITSLENKPTI